jgi:hypothetical protein
VEVERAGGFEDSVELEHAVVAEVKLVHPARVLRLSHIAGKRFVIGLKIAQPFMAKGIVRGQPGGLSLPKMRLFPVIGQTRKLVLQYCRTVLQTGGGRSQVCQTILQTCKLILQTCKTFRQTSAIISQSFRQVLPFCQSPWQVCGRVWQTCKIILQICKMRSLVCRFTKKPQK